MAVAVLTQEAGDETKTRMTLNGHATVQEWQTACAGGGRDSDGKTVITSTSDYGYREIKGIVVDRR